MARCDRSGGTGAKPITWYRRELQHQSQRDHRARDHTRRARRENIEAGIRAAETEGRHLLAELETEFPAGTGPVTDAVAQEAVARIVARLREESAQS